MKVIKWILLFSFIVLLVLFYKAFDIYSSNRTRSEIWLKHPALPGKLVDVGGRRLYATLKGTGSATVIIEAGLASASPEWWRVQNELSRVAKVLTYDRAGYGWSDPAPRGEVTPVEDLDMLIRRMRILPPLILVGHDIGALYVIEYVRRHRGRVKGIALVDPFPVKYQRFRDELEKAVYKNFIDQRSSYKIGSFFGRMGIVRWLKIIPYMDVHEDLRPLIIENFSLGKTYEAALGESGKGLKERLEGIAKPWKSYGMPMVLVTRSQIKYYREMLFFGVPVDEARKIEAIADDSYRTLEALFPRHTRISADSSSRNIHLGEPELIVKAVRNVLP